MYRAKNLFILKQAFDRQRACQAVLNHIRKPILTNCSIRRTCSNVRHFSKVSSTVNTNLKTADKEHSPISNKYEFQAETKMLLDIVAKSLYSEKEVFLRELISNASDALEKARYLRVSQGAQSIDSEMKIKIDTDSRTRTITIEDNGIGMTKEEMINNLGTIARSGSKAFIQELRSKGESDMANTVIGQFGVGFYSAFMVAEKVEVFTKSIEEKDEGYLWISDGSGSYEIRNYPKDEPGTKIVIHLKEDDKMYAEQSSVDRIIKKYSSFIAHPIILNGTQANTIQPLWLMNPKEISQEQHREFYKFMTGATDSPRFVLHYKVDVPYAINAVLYFPESKPAYFDPNISSNGLTLYSRRVLIKHKTDELIPKWLRFLHGVVESEDIPLNLSREILQNTVLLRTIREALTAKIFKFLEEKSTKERVLYASFFREFGPFFKEGIIAANSQNEREELSRLLLFETSHQTEGELTTLGEYVKRMKNGQRKIYFLSTPSRSLAETSPYMEAMKNKDYEVLYCYDPFDELVLMQMNTLKGTPLCSVEGEARSSSNNDDSTSTEDKSNNIDELLGWLKKIFKEKIDSAIVNKSLVGHPCIVTVEEMSKARQYLKFHGRHLDDELKYSIIRPRMELNPNNLLIKELNSMFKTNEPLATLIAEQLLKNALVYAGLLDDARKVVDNVNKIIELALKEAKANSTKENN